MGMSHFGEISRMARTAEPSIGVITNIGYSHIENLKTQEGIRQAKLEIQDGMAADAPLVVNGDDPLLAPLKRELSRPVITYGMHSEKADVRAADVERKAQSTSFSILAQDGSTYPVELPCARRPQRNECPCGVLRGTAGRHCTGTDLQGSGAVSHRRTAAEYLPAGCIYHYCRLL